MWRRAVELADGWEWNWGRAFSEDVNGLHAFLFDDDKNPPAQWHKDAIAAQLVRQVDALDDAGLTVWGDQVCEIRDYSGEERIIAKGNAGTDRTENTVNAILDSGVL